MEIQVLPHTETVQGFSGPGSLGIQGSGAFLDTTFKVKGKLFRLASPSPNRDAQHLAGLSRFLMEHLAHVG